MLPPIVPPSRRASDLILRVDPAVTRADRRQFVSLTHQLYRGDRRWIPPFAGARRHALRPGRNTVPDGGPVRALLGMAQNLGLGDELVGVIAAWGAPGDPDGGLSEWGSWGLFEAMNLEDLADRLFSEAENWLFEHGAAAAGIRGPCSLEPLVAPGFLTDGFDAQPTAFLPYTLPYYPELVEGQGYEPAFTWRAYLLELPHHAHRSELALPVDSGMWDKLALAYSRIEEAEGEGPDLMPGLVEWLNHLAGAGPLDFDGWWQSAMRQAFRRAIAVVGEEDEPEEPVGCLGVPDIGPALRLSSGRRWPLGWLLFRLGLARTHRLHAFPAVAPVDWPVERLADLYTTLVERAAAAGYYQINIAPIAEGDERSPEALAAVGARPAQQFTIYEKAG